MAGYFPYNKVHPSGRPVAPLYARSCTVSNVDRKLKRYLVHVLGELARPSFLTFILKHHKKMYKNV